MKPQLGSSFLGWAVAAAAKPHGPVAEPAVAGGGVPGISPLPTPVLAAAFGDSDLATAKSLSSVGLCVLICKLVLVRAGRLTMPGTGGSPPSWCVGEQRS